MMPASCAHDAASGSCGRSRRQQRGRMPADGGRDHTYSALFSNSVPRRFLENSAEHRPLVAE